MKKLLLLSLLLTTRIAFAGFTPATHNTGSAPTTFTLDGNTQTITTDLQGAINVAVRGDIISIPAGDYTITAPINVQNSNGTPKNLWIHGALMRDATSTGLASGNVTSIKGTSPTVPNPLFLLNTENTPSPYVTMRLSNMRLFGEQNKPNGKVVIDGNAQVHIDANQVATGGLRIDHIWFDVDHSLTSGNASGEFNMTGTPFVTGVVDHCLIDHTGALGNITRGGNEVWLINHNTEPGGTNLQGVAGEFTWGPNFHPKYGGFETMCFEDNIVLHPQYWLDNKQGAPNGGGEWVIRYNTFGGCTNGGHGNQEGDYPMPARLREEYNNHFVGNTAYGDTVGVLGGGNASWGDRGGQVVRFNSYRSYIGVSGSPHYLVNSDQISYGVTMIGDYWDQGHDGRNKWDENQRNQEDPTRTGDNDGKFNWPTASDGITNLGPPGGGGWTYYRDKGYAHAPPAGHTLQESDVTDGKPADTREGYVYFHGTGGTSTGEAADGTGHGAGPYTISGIKLNNDNPNMTAAMAAQIPANYLAGFMIVGADIDRSKAKTTNASPSDPAPYLINYGFITSNTAGDANNQITISMGTFNPQADVHHMLLMSGAPGCTPVSPTCTAWEIRKARTLSCAPGLGSADTTFAASGPGVIGNIAKVTGSPLTPSPRWLNWAKVGSFYWRNYYRRAAGDPTSTTIWSPIAAPSMNYSPPGGTAMLAVAGLVHVPTFTNSSNSNDMADGYPFDPNVVPGSSNPKTRVGADWAVAAGSASTGKPPLYITDTRSNFPQPNGPSTLYSFYPPNDTATHKYHGAINSTVAYPHPLVGPVTPAAPVISPGGTPNTDTDSWTVGTSKTHNFSASGPPAPAFATPTPLPSGSSFTDNGGGSADFTFNPANTTANNSTLSVVATNSQGSNTQTFTIKVNAVANTKPSVSLTGPTTLTYTAPATITLAATASDPDSGDSVAKVDFYRDQTDPSHLIGTGTLSAGVWTYSWTSVPSGNYSVYAIAYDTSNSAASNNSNTKNITVSGTTPLTTTLIQPADNQNFLSIDTVQFEASAIGPNPISKVEFYDGTNLLTSDISSPYLYSWVHPAAGSHTVKARAYDTVTGNTAEDTATIAVTTATPTPAPTPAQLQVRP